MDITRMAAKHDNAVRGTGSMTVEKFFDFVRSQSATFTYTPTPEGEYFSVDAKGGKSLTVRSHSWQRGLPELVTAWGDA